MAYANTTLLGLNQPTTGQESGVWGDDVNNGFTQLVDLSVAGTNNITQDSDITLTVTNGNNSSAFTSTATNSTVAQYYVLNCTGARTAARNIIAPASSRSFLITNGTTGGFAITIKKTAGTGVSIAAGETAIVYYNIVTGDYAKGTTSVVSAAGSNTQVQYNSSGSFAGSANFTFNGTTATINTLNLTNALGVAYGGTGLTSYTANGVLYASGTGTIATGSGFVFDGTNVGIGTSSPSTRLHVVGSVANGSVAFFNNTDTANGNGVYIQGGGSNSGKYAFQVANAAGTSLAYLDSSGNLGLGVTPSAWNGKTAYQAKGGSFVGDASATYFSSNWYYGSGGDTYITTGYATQYVQYAGQHQWKTAPSSSGSITFTQAMTLDASGNLLLGTTNSYARLMVGYGYDFPVVKISNTFNNFNSGILALGDGNSTTNNVGVWRGNANSVSSGGNYLNLGGYDGIVFASSNAAIGSQAERARIDSSGRFLVGKSVTSLATNGINIQGDGYFSSSMSQSTSANTTFEIYSTGAGAYRFYVDLGGTIHATSTSITAISDQSLKTNIKPLETGLAEVMALQPCRFDWINGDASNVAGFIAQEVERILPDLVAPFKYNEDETKLGLKMGDMIPTLVKAIQELKADLDNTKAQVTTLQTQVTALQAKGA